MAFKSAFLQELSDRGLIYQGTHLEALDQLAAEKSLTLYIGFDATAPSLHVGHLMPIMVLRLAQKHGHKPIVIMGGGTTKLGDPSFKDTARPLLDSATINSNLRSIQKIFAKYLKFGSSSADALILNNDDWLGALNYLDFLRDYGRHFSVNRMLTFEGVKLRLEREQSLSFLEFNYMILQGYDFLELYRRHDCVLQMGGSDQWGNILNGVELVRRTESKEVFGLTYPLLTTSSGKKMGKSEQGAVWLNSDQLSPFDFWQFWRNTDDADVLSFLKIFTDLPLAQIATYEGVEGEGLNALKVLLADEATKLAHGEAVLSEIQKSAHQLFDQHHLSVEVTGHDAEGNPILKTGLPVVKISADVIKAGMPIYDLLVQAGLCPSKSEGRRLVRGGGVSVNGAKVTDENTMIDASFLQEPGIIRVSVGKKTHVILQPIS
ncbi:MAG: tyrosine--tRNA ligase [Alphaproteobacteria bacterium]